MESRGSNNACVVWGSGIEQCFRKILACFNLKRILGNSYSLYSGFGIYQNLTVGNSGHNWYLSYNKFQYVVE